MVVMVCLGVLLSRSVGLAIKVVALCLILCGGKDRGACKIGVGLGLLLFFFFFPGLCLDCSYGHQMSKFIYGKLHFAT